MKRALEQLPQIVAALALLGSMALTAGPMFTSLLSPESMAEASVERVVEAGHGGQ